MSYPDPDEYNEPSFLRSCIFYIVVLIIALFVIAMLSGKSHADEMPSQQASSLAISQKLTAEINHGLTCDARVIDLQKQIDDLKAKAPDSKKK